MALSHTDLLEQYSALLRARDESGEMPSDADGVERRHDFILRGLVDDLDFEGAKDYIAQFKSFARKRGDLQAYYLYCGYSKRVDELYENYTNPKPPIAGIGAFAPSKLGKTLQSGNDSTSQS